MLLFPPCLDYFPPSPLPFCSLSCCPQIVLMPQPLPAPGHVDGAAQGMKAVQAAWGREAVPVSPRFLLSTWLLIQLLPGAARRRQSRVDGQ